MLNNIRHKLNGTAYNDGSGATELKCGATGTVACTGYELMTDLDFNNAAHYASGSANTSVWKANNAPNNATNAGWVPVGTNSTPFAAIFDGNGHTISNLYTRDTAHTNRVGFFGVIGGSGKVRNMIVHDGSVYGGAGGDWIGIIVGGINSGGVLMTSSASGSANGEAGNEDNVGGLVGVNFGTIIASYATSDATGGAGTTDKVGGIAGYNGGTIIASYATGAADGGADGSSLVGGLVGESNGGTITASYATATTDGGAGSGDIVGSLVGKNSGGTVTASYAFGATTGGETVGHSGSTKPAGVTRVSQLTAPATTAATAAPAVWKQTASNTNDAWDFGTAIQAPALKYADYDGGGSDYACTSSSGLTCGTTLLLGQVLLRTALFIPQNLTVMASNRQVALNWDSVPGATEYRVYRATGGASATRIGTTATTSYTDRNLVNGTSYTYTVQSVSADGESIRSTPKTATPPLIPTSWKNNNATTITLRSVHHANSTWIAVGDGGTIITSTSGTIWTSHTSPTTNRLFSVHHANGRWVVVGGRDNNTIIITSTNGTTWTILTSPMADGLRSVHHANGRWVAVGGHEQANSGTIITSTSGTIWTIQTSPPATRLLYSVHHANGTWVAGGGSAPSSPAPAAPHGPAKPSPRTTVYAPSTTQTAHGLLWGIATPSSPAPTAPHGPS